MFIGEPRRTGRKARRQIPAVASATADVFYRGWQVKICYVDEAGCLGKLPSATSDIQPVFILTGLFVEQSVLCDLTRDFMSMKCRYFPYTTTPNWLDCIRCEVKGSDLRMDIRKEYSKKTRLVVSYLKNIMELLNRHGAQFVSRVWIKGIGGEFNGRSIYTSSVQAMCEYFQHYLHEKNDDGLIIADARNKIQNSLVSHSIFTRKFKHSSDVYPRLVEMPTFGHAENHAGLQLTDTLCSALIFPLSIYLYCRGYVTNVHMSENYLILKQQLANNLRLLQYRYQDGNGRWTGGITVSDNILQRSGALFFQ